jgi:hypothetical protein
MSLENIHAHNHPFLNGRFRTNPSFIKPFPSDMNTSHINQAICDSANQESAGRILFYQFIKKVDRFVGDSWVLDAKQLLLAREFDIINRLPSTYSNELKDQSKGDALLKLAAMGQIIYLVFRTSNFQLLSNDCYRELLASSLLSFHCHPSRVSGLLTSQEVSRSLREEEGRTERRSY